MFQTELQLCKCIIQIRRHVDYVEPWAHRYCDDTRTISEHHIYTWLVPVLIIPRSCSIVVVPDFSSLPLWCILWYMVLRKYCTSDSRLCYIFYFIRWWFILKPVKHTLKTAYCIWPDYVHALWILIVLPPVHLMTVLIKYAFS